MVILEMYWTWHGQTQMWVLGLFFVCFFFWDLLIHFSYELGIGFCSFFFQLLKTRQFGYGELVVMSVFISSIIITTVTFWTLNSVKKNHVGYESDSYQTWGGKRLMFSSILCACVTNTFIYVYVWRGKRAILLIVKDWDWSWPFHSMDSCFSNFMKTMLITYLLIPLPLLALLISSMESLSLSLSLSVYIHTITHVYNSMKRV